jgi:hypothetical protein
MSLFDLISLIFQFGFMSQQGGHLDRTIIFVDIRFTRGLEILAIYSKQGRDVSPTSYPYVIGVLNNITYKSV